MKHAIRLLLSAFTASLALSLAVSTASANSGFEVGSPGLITVVFSELTFSGEEGGETICPLTLRLTLHRTIAKSVNALAGYVTDARFGEEGCEFGRFRALTETFPWHIKYVSFTGVLPNISSITIDIPILILLDNIVRCLYEGLIRLITNGPNINRVTADPERTIPLFRALNAFPCPRNARAAGSATVSPTVSLRLLA